MVKTKWKSTRGNGVEDSVEYPTWWFTMVRQINKIFVYKQVYFKYAL